ncbi:MAG TPA: aminoglycoside phosphotransferase family protein [Terracidiphilus sp.]|nr:aminoglycoside phosphotransferase family protein [Terracidiphilus sp.]
MTRDGSFKSVVRRHAGETGQRYTQSLTDLEELQTRMSHQPAGERLVAHLRDHYGIAATAATKTSQHHDNVFRIDRGDGAPWIARSFSLARPRAGVEGDAAILRFLERHDYPAERLATDDAVSVCDGSTVLVTRFIPGTQLPMAVGNHGSHKFAIMGDLLGRLHTLPLDESVRRPGGASGDDPRREGSPRQDLLAALAFLDAVDTKVAPADRERFERLRDLVRSADDGQGLPKALLHGNLLHAPDHVVVGESEPVAINWKAAGCGPRLADFAWLMWGTWGNEDWIKLAVGAYRRYVELTEEELERLEAVMHIRPLYLGCFSYRRDLINGRPPSREVWGFANPRHIGAIAAATRAAFRR